MALNQSSSSLRKWMWMERMPTPCLFIWRKSFHSPVMTPWLSWLIHSALFGALSEGMTSPGTSRSSWSVRMESPTSATAEISSPVTLRPILKSYFRGSSKLCYDTLWMAVKGYQLRPARPKRSVIAAHLFGVFYHVLSNFTVLRQTATCVMFVISPVQYTMVVQPIYRMKTLLETFFSWGEFLMKM